ncbi:MAG: hypothetical protein R3B95_16715 [Nitrospirales bacterium]|nr:hypothetical protein [Nitrospirales bacterium]
MRLLIKGSGSVQKSPSSKAAAVFTRGAYAQYVSTEKWRERRWRLFSTDPKGIPSVSDGVVPFRIPQRKIGLLLPNQ